MVLSWTVSEIRRLIGWKLHTFPTPLLFGALAPCVPLGISGWSNHEETRVMGLLNGESCMILASSVFDWSTRVTDRQTDGRTDGRAIAHARYSIICCRAQKLINALDLKTSRLIGLETWRLLEHWPPYVYNVIYSNVPCLCKFYSSC